MRVHALLVDGQDLAGLHVADELGAHRVQCGALRRHRPAGAVAGRRNRQPAQRQRPEAEGVAAGDQRPLGDHAERDGADGAVERVLNPLGPAATRSVGDELGEHLGVAGGGELDALFHQVIVQPGRVRQVAVVAEHQLTKVGCCVDRLHVGQRVAAGGRVAGVADRDSRLSRPVVLELGERLLVEDAADQSEPLVQRQARPVADGNPGGLLPAVLQRMEAEVGEARNRAAGCVDADYAALLTRAVGLVDGQLSDRVQ